MSRKHKRLTPIRLGDIPFEKRIAAARREAQHCADESQRTELLAAAMFPSQRVYWVYADATSAAA